ncbi:hypothetical protein J3A83DRAFT_4370818 [Scleroderma citrinum]
MAKGQKSSASSGTRKKNARKAAAAAAPTGSASNPLSSSPIPATKPLKNTKYTKRELKEARKREKVYIPPVKPAPPQLDPLDTTGLARTLPPDLVIVLRSLAKKDVVTRTKALEELSKWVDDAAKEPSDVAEEDYATGEKAQIVIEILPVWLHRIPVLFTHPVRRIRFLAASLQTNLIRLPPARSALVRWAQEQASQEELETVLGTWTMLAHDVDRGVAIVGERALTEFIGGLPNLPNACPLPRLELTQSMLVALLDFSRRTVLDPAGLHAALNPVAAPVVPTVIHVASGKKGGPPIQRKGAQMQGRKSGQPALQAKKGGRYVPPPTAEPHSQPSPRSESPAPGDTVNEESKADRNGRLQASALGTVKWIVDNYLPNLFTQTSLAVDTAPVSILQLLSQILSSPYFWSSLHPGPVCPYTSAEISDSTEEKGNEEPSTGVCFGYFQPQVRRAAWALVATIVDAKRGTLPHVILQVLSSAILRSAWVEMDVGVRGFLTRPLLMFLKNYPQAWAIDAERAVHGYKEGEGDQDQESEEGSESEGESETEDDTDTDAEQGKNPDSIMQPSKEDHAPPSAFREFLGFLELGCAGYAVEGYPLVLVVVAGIPETILLRSLALPSVTQLLDALWAPLYARVLPERRAAVAWLRALLECLVFVVRRACEVERRPEAPEETVTEPETGRDNERKVAQSLLAAQFTALGDALRTRTLRVDEVEAASTFAGALGRISKIGEDLFGVTFDAIASGLSKEDVQSPNLAPTFLHVFAATFAPDTLAGQRTRVYIRAYISNVIQNAEAVLCEAEEARQVVAKVARLVTVMGTFGATLFEDHEFTSSIDALFTSHSLTLLRSSPSAVTFYLKHRSEAGTPDALDKTQMFWTGVLTSVASYASSLPTPLDQVGSVQALLSSVLSAAQEGLLPGHLRGASGTMDTEVFKLLEYGMKHHPESAVEELLSSLLSVHFYFISSDGLAAITQTLSQNIATYAKTTLQVAGIPHSSLIDTDGVSVASVNLELKLVRKLANAGHQIIGEKGAELYVGVVLLAFIIPSPGEGDDDSMKETEEARMIWSTFVADIGNRDGSEEMRQAVGALLKEQLRKGVVDSRILSCPDHVIRALSRGVPGLPIDVLSDILPSRSELDMLLDDLPTSAISPSLALMDWTIPTSISEEENNSDFFTDTGNAHILPLHPYGRAISALLIYLSSARTEARTHLWVLRHVIAFGVYATEYVRVGVERNAVIGGPLDVKPERDPVTLERREIAMELLERVHALTIYLLGRVEEDVHTRAVGALLNNDGNASIIEGSLASFVVEVVRKSAEYDTIRDALILRAMLQHLFVDATKEDADLWLTLVRRLEKTAPQTATVILACITEYAPEPPKLDRYRNELAAALLGVKPRDSNTTGLRYLRLLCASAPNPDSDVVFLPQHRAVNVMRACQRWIAEDDEDVDEDLESMMTLIFQHMAPILQDVSGSHWDFIWDVVENNLETCSLEESDTLATLGRTLQLVIVIEDLVATNKSLREGWESRRQAILNLIRNLVTVDTSEMPYSDPRALCRELAVSIIQDVPFSMMDEKTLATFLHLITDHSSDVQKMSYHYLQRAAHKLTEHFVIEAGVDTEDVVEVELPIELLTTLQQSLGVRGELELDATSSSRNQEVSGYLLAWMITFDLFTNASFKVRSSYFNHMRSLDIISQYFIPSIFDVLGLFTGGKNTFKLDIWAVDEFYLDTYEPTNSLSLKLLAAHLYHRALLAVPAMIRSWISDCTDKQLLARVIDYTSTYFSPRIIRTELALVRQSQANSELSATENLSIKVSSALNEVTASYTVDDQVLELSIRMPNDWPLHRFDVRDTKMVGVSEDRWRAWVLGVQQTVWQQNSRIVDALTLFAKNVSLHFAGQVECAICYSIISVMDASLPQKPCRTCKNRFHAGCLYKVG